MSEVEGREDAETGEAQEEAESQRPNVKMREAKDIGRSVDFTPHALASKGRPAPRSGTRAAAKRRRILYTSAAVVVVAAVGRRRRPVRQPPAAVREGQGRVRHRRRR